MPQLKRKLNNPFIYFSAIVLAGIAALVVLTAVILPCLAFDLFPSYFRSDIHEGRIKIEYWEKWTGFEGEEMQKVIDKFNQSQSRIWVEKRPISRIEQRFLVSVAGKNPPDLAGLQAFMIPNFAEKGALKSLDELASEFNIKKEDYLSVFWDMGVYQNKLYALPTTPATLALHYNKRLFREAGLDPDKPPQTLDELDSMAEKLTRYNNKGKIKTIGFTPSYPGWWLWAWGFWFGGRLTDEKGRITMDDAGNVKSLVWVQNYARKYGLVRLQEFEGGFGRLLFASPQNPFLTEQVAMELQGVWMFNFIDKYNPKLEWGVAPFPAVEGLENVTLADCDDLVIPTDAPHPREAFEFISFVQQQENMELLCMEQRKFSPLKKVSEDFWIKHPHPYIKLFYELAESPNAKTQPMIPMFQQMREEMNSAFSEVWLLKKTPEQALERVQNRIHRAWESQKRVEEAKSKSQNSRLGKK